MKATTNSALLMRLMDTASCSLSTPSSASCALKSSIAALNALKLMVSVAFERVAEGGRISAGLSLLCSRDASVGMSGCCYDNQVNVERVSSRLISLRGDAHSQSCGNFRPTRPGSKTGGMQGLETKTSFALLVHDYTG